MSVLGVLCRLAWALDQEPAGHNGTTCWMVSEGWQPLPSAQDLSAREPGGQPVLPTPLC
jgi:hypothetical protein